jgi:hypothetical protein
MLVLAMFLSIGFAAVLFLLRFLFALDSEISSERKRSKTRVDHITAYRTPSGILVYGTAPALTLAHSNSWRPDVRVRPISTDSRERNSQLKEA